MTLVEQAQEYIRNLIITGQYDSNGYLPSEGDLCSTLHMSKPTVREAVRSLEVRGLLLRVHGKGLRVVDNPMQNLTQSMEDMIDKRDLSYQDILEVRKLIEVHAAIKAATCATEENLEKMKAFIHQLEQCSSHDLSYTEADLGFHLALVESAGNPLLLGITKAYTPLIQNYISKSNAGNEHLENTKHYHREIYEGIYSRNPVLAKRAIQMHLIESEKNLNNRLTRQDRPPLPKSND